MLAKKYESCIPSSSHCSGLRSILTWVTWDEDGRKHQHAEVRQKFCPKKCLLTHVVFAKCLVAENSSSTFMQTSHRMLFVHSWAMLQHHPSNCIIVQNLVVLCLISVGAFKTLALLFNKYYADILFKSCWRCGGWRAVGSGGSSLSSLVQIKLLVNFDLSQLCFATGTYNSRCL